MKVFSLKRLFLVYSLPLVLTLCLLTVFGVFERPDLFFLDRAFQWRGEREPGAELAIVAISQDDFERGAPPWPWPRSLMARLIDQVSRHRPATLVIDILYTEESKSGALITREEFPKIQEDLFFSLSGNELVKQDRKGKRVIRPSTIIAEGVESAKMQDRELAEAVRRAVESGVDVVLATQAITGGGEIGKDVEGIDVPYPGLAEASGNSMGLVGILQDRDGVLRRYLPYARDKDGNYVYALSLQAVAVYKDTNLPEIPLPGGDVLLGDGTLIELTDGQVLVNFRGGPGTYPIYNSGDILRADEDFSGRLKGKIVFIGVTDPSAEDEFPTPFSGSHPMAGVEYHAAAADTILSESFIQIPPRYQQVLLVIVLCLGAISLGRFPRPLLGFGGAVLVAGALLGGWIGSFAAYNYFLPIAGPLAALLSGYAVALTDRVSVEQLEKQQARSMLSRYLPPDIVEEMLKNPIDAQLVSRRVDLTVLFSDIRGFTTLSEKLDPEAVVELLNEYLTVMTEVIFRHGGTVDKFEGDAILVFFGAPQHHADDPERAVRTALEMRDRLSELQEHWMERTEEPLRIGIAINSGEVMVGNIGSQRRMDYTIIGDTVNLASRLQDLTKDFGASILISGSTHLRAQHMCRVRPLGSVEIRGREQSVDLYEVLDLKADSDVPENAMLNEPTLG